MMSSIYFWSLFKYEPSLTALMGRCIYRQGIKIPCYKIITRASGSILRDQLFFTTTPTSQGTGLSLSNDIIKAHGGDIKVETQSEPARAGWPADRHGKDSEGAEFIIQLPFM